MNSKNTFRFFLVLLALGLFVSLAVGCNVADTVPTPSPTPTNAPTETSLPVSLTPTYAYHTRTPVPTAIPYPTASVVKSNAVAFISYDEHLNDSLWVANVDGSGERKLADVKKKDSLASWLLQWSPNGEWISYRLDNDLWLVSRDGSIKRKVLSPLDSMGYLCTYVWSPDSSQIAYIQAANPWAAVSQIIVGILDLETGKVSEISSNEAPDPKPLSWSPDGKYILFAKDFSYSLFEVATGKITKEIKPNGMSCWVGWSIWSPNSKWFFDTEHGNGRYSYNWICVSGLDGSNRKINVDGTASVPVWDKTGNFLYFVTRKTNPDGDPNLQIDERLMRYDVKTQKIEPLLSLRERQTYDYIQSVLISPDKRTLLLESQFSNAKFDLIFINLQSLATIKYTVDFEDLKVPFLYSYILETAWSPDDQNLILFAGDFCTPSGCGGGGPRGYGSFYTLNIKTGKASIFSGEHSIYSWQASPIAISP